MPLLHPHLKHRKHKVMIRGHVKGSGILDTATMALIQSGLPWDKIFGSIGAATYGALGTAAATYGIKKLTEHKAVNQPPLAVSPAPQGTKSDILPVKSDITIVNPENHYIDLNDGMKKINVNTIVTPQRKAGLGIKKYKKGGKMSYQSPGIKIKDYPAVPPRELNNILSDKSKQILSNFKGSGIMQM